MERVGFDEILTSEQEYTAHVSSSPNVVPDLIGIQDASRHARLPGLVPCIPSCISGPLIEKGYTLASGESFGCDYLAYPGDPGVFHSYLEIHRMRSDDRVSVADLLGMERAAASVKKIPVLAIEPSLNDPACKSVEFLTIERFQWDTVGDETESVSDE